MALVRITADPEATHSASLGPAKMPVAGASHAFDPGRDGLAGMYASRVLDRGIDPRALYAEVRADRLGASERGAVSRALIERPRPTRFGRGTAAHLAAMAANQAQPEQPTKRVRSNRARTSWSLKQPELRLSRRLATAGLAMLLLLPLGALAASGQELPAQARYIAQAGDTVEGIAAEFGVDPAAILAASTLANPPYLTAEDVLVIPHPGESPDDAAWNAYQQDAGPFVVAAHSVAEGETMGDISYWYNIDAWTLANFNGIADIESLDVGQRLLVPLTDAVALPDEGGAPEYVAMDSPEEVWQSTTPAGAVGGVEAEWSQSVSDPIYAADVPAYMQMYSLSCEYAAAYIATAAFGAGVPESAFVESVPASANPHWGYRGDIHGPWGGTDDYGVYAEALVPTLNNHGFVADVFYGADVESITSRLDAGMPVMTWLGYFGHNAWQQADEGSYLLAPGMHVVTVYGYDDGGVYLVNPGRGSYDYYAWGDFLDKWSVIDGMALAVAPM